jgi:hypothetical protein
VIAKLSEDNKKVVNICEIEKVNEPKRNLTWTRSKIVSTNQNSSFQRRKSSFLIDQELIPSACWNYLHQVIFGYCMITSLIKTHPKIIDSTEKHHQNSSDIPDTKNKSHTSSESNDRELWCVAQKCEHKFT